MTISSPSYLAQVGRLSIVNLYAHLEVLKVLRLLPLVGALSVAMFRPYLHIEFVETVFGCSPYGHRVLEWASVRLLEKKNQRI